MKIEGEWFKDELGRTLQLRGVNLGGNTKYPYRPDGSTWRKGGFYEYKGVSFVGRPFPLAEADEHFRRLKHWGFTFERFLVSWEAVEHDGPGIYDEEYLEYVRAVVEKAAEYGIDIYIDPHQDVWSRWTGGSGAPAWTMEVVGMDITRIDEVGAAIVHNVHEGPYPHMIWDTNNYKFGTCTMFTLFFGGKDFAPRCMIEGQNVQEYLQRHYISAIKKLAVNLKGLRNVVGYGSLNEPQCGYIEFRDLVTDKEFRFIGEAAPGPLDSMAAAAGYPRTVNRYKMKITGSKKIGRITINPEGLRLWKPGYDCMWKEHGVWTDEGGEPRILREDYFTHVNGVKVSFVNDYLKPFVLRFAREIRTVHPGAIVFIEAVPAKKDFPSLNPQESKDFVNASHWYDVLMVYRNKFSPWFSADVFKEKLVIGKKRVLKSFADQFRHLKNFSRDRMNGGPTLIGEFGFMYKLYNGRAYRTGDYTKHITGLASYYQALDANLIGGTIWHYAADNTNEHGDNWNEEDASIFSRDQQSNPGDINSGGRAVEGFCRPYAAKTAGTPLSMSFNLKKRRFIFTFRPDPGISAPTELFIPRIHYPKGYRVELTGGTYQKDDAQQLLLITSTGDAETRVTVTPVT
jgi:hypothetical protein